MMEDARCCHCPTEQLVDLVLNSAHERLRARCDRSMILAMLEDKHAAYDTHGVHTLLAARYDAVEELLESSGAAPPAFVSSLWMLVQPQTSPAADKEAGGPGPSQEQPPAEAPNLLASRLLASRFPSAASLARAS